ncbi:MAG: 16S rRNA (adenine(1518)-N(6)/adenine(1519)-N(6))-dimethyltransferase RsmA [Acidobacteriota bacterium]
MRDGWKGSRSRRWAQNFLINAGAAEAIVAAFRPRPDDAVVEIGPGRGALTRRLAGRVDRLLGVEIDPELGPALRRALADCRPAGGLEIVEGDVLEIDLARLLRRVRSGGRPARLIANLPYNIATRVIVRCLRLRPLLSDLLVMVQREVAARVLSAPGTKVYGGLSVLCQTYASVERVMRLRPGSFRPRPRVESEVIRLTLRDPGGAASRDFDAYAGLVRAAFARRRRTLLNNLARLPGASPEEAGRLIRRAGLDPGMRPEAVPVDGYRALLDAWRPL